MDSNNSHHEESINSSEEVDQKHENVDLGVGRSYECVFCKRGFNTAQALGGHMNIHRKDRVKNKPSTSSNKQEEATYDIHTGPRLMYQQIPISNYKHHLFEPHHDDLDHQYHLNYPTYFPASKPTTRSPFAYGVDCDHFQKPAIDDPSIQAGDWRMSNFSQDSERNINQVIMNKKEDLDLELRLGYD